MLRFIRCVAEAVLSEGVRGLAEMVPGGGYVYRIADRILNGYAKGIKEEQLRAEIQQVAQQSAEVARQMAREVMQVVPRDANARLEPEEAITLELYLSVIPESVRQSLKRTEDPSGKSVPLGLQLKTPSDVVRLLPQRPPRFRPGTELPQRRGWTLDRLLGIGGFGEVWLARNRLSTKLVGAVKFCHPEQAGELHREGDILSVLMDADDHPNIVKIKDSCLDGESPWLMYEYVPGGTLTDCVRAFQNLPSEHRFTRVLEIIVQLVDAVAFFHRLDPPIVHRDLKPSNVLLDTKGTPRITDFGIGSLIACAELRDESLGRSTRGGRLLAHQAGGYTPDYASPQQRAGGEPDPRDDVYALGVISYQLLTGHLAQGPGTDFAEDLRSAGASEKFIALIGKCVSQKPERRPRDGTELKGLLSTNMSGKSASRVPPSRPVLRALNLPVVQLKVELEQALELLKTIPHRTFSRALTGKWKVNDGKFVDLESVEWLYRWAKTGMNSQRAAAIARDVFDRIFDVPFVEYSKTIEQVIPDPN